MFMLEFEKLVHFLPNLLDVIVWLNIVWLKEWLGMNNIIKLLNFEVNNDDMNKITRFFFLASSKVEHLEI